MSAFEDAISLEFLYPGQELEFKLWYRGDSRISKCNEWCSSVLFFPPSIGGSSVPTDAYFSLLFVTSSSVTIHKCSKTLYILVGTDWKWCTNRKNVWETLFLWACGWDHTNSG
jgi:hypothetical protein